MSTEITRSQLSRVLVAGGLVSAASFVLVTPRMSEAGEQVARQSRQLEYIEQGESHIANYQADLQKLIESTQQTRDAMLDDLSPHPELKDQQLFQRYASDHGITLTRVEPMKSSPVTLELGSPEYLADMQRKAFRLEMRGAYSDVISYIDQLQSSTCRMRVTSFRAVPSGEQDVRCTLNVSMVELSSYPQILSEPIVSDGTTGRSNSLEEQE